MGHLQIEPRPQLNSPLWRRIGHVFKHRDFEDGQSGIKGSRGYDEQLSRSSFLGLECSSEFNHCGAL